MILRNLGLVILFQELKIFHSQFFMPLFLINVFKSKLIEESREKITLSFLNPEKYST